MIKYYVNLDLNTGILYTHRGEFVHSRLNRGYDNFPKSFIDKYTKSFDGYKYTVLPTFYQRDSEVLIQDYKDYYLNQLKARIFRKHCRFNIDLNIDSDELAVCGFDIVFNHELFPECLEYVDVLGNGYAGNLIGEYYDFWHNHNDLLLRPQAFDYWYFHNIPFILPYDPPIYPNCNKIVEDAVLKIKQKSEKSNFDYDLEKIKKAIESGSVSMPESVKTSEDIQKWIKEQADKASV